MAPWGRSPGEYARTFAPTPQDLRGRILACGAGPASFNAEPTAAGHRTSSCDIRRRVEETSGPLLATVREHADRFVWREIESPEKLGEPRLAAMYRFLEDLPAGPDPEPAAEMGAAAP